MSKDTSSAHATNPAGNVATVTLAAEHLGILPPETPYPIANHSIDPETGYLESNAYATTFDAGRKRQFLELYRANGLGVYRTCKQMSLHHKTLNQAVKLDAVFKADMDQVERDYIDELESKSRNIALTSDKATLERIFQLRALRPEKYAREQSHTASTHQVILNITGLSVDNIKSRQGVIDVKAEKALPELTDDLHFAKQLSHSPTVINSSSEPLMDSPTETATVPRT